MWLLLIVSITHYGCGSSYQHGEERRDMDVFDVFERYRDPEIPEILTTCLIDYKFYNGYTLKLLSGIYTDSTGTVQDIKILELPQFSYGRRSRSLPDSIWNAAKESIRAESRHW